MLGAPAVILDLRHQTVSVQLKFPSSLVWVNR